MMYGPATAGSGTAWVGLGPTYFDDDAVYDVEGEAAGLAEWALTATRTAVDPAALRALLAPSWTVDLVEALTELMICRELSNQLVPPLLAFRFHSGLSPPFVNPAWVTTS